MTADRRARLIGPIVACLSLGLAPLVPEPHVVEKVRWVLQGGAGMRPIDVFDLFLHGAPWVWLGVTLLRPAPAAPTRVEVGPDPGAV